MIRMCEHKLVSHPEIDPEFNPATITAKDMILNLIAEQNKELISELLELKKDLHDKVTRLSQDIKNIGEQRTVRPVREEVTVSSLVQPAFSNKNRKTNTVNIRKNTMRKTAYQKKPKILIVGDSVTHNANLANIEKDTKSRVRTVKAHSSVRDKRARWPEKNHADVVPKALKAVHEGDEYEYLVLGAPTVDITNMNTSHLSQNDNTEV